MKLESGWVPVALSSSIEAGTSAGAVVEGQEIVVWRDNSGKAHVWEDRCPHRGMRMSFGFVRGDHIACLYHGWQYDTAGQCRHIPAHPSLEVPDTIKVPTYKAVETLGLVWATASESGNAPVAPDATEKTPLRSLYVDAPLATLVDALETDAFETVSESGGTLTVGGAKLFVGLQSVGATKSAAHFIVLAAATPMRLKTLSAWAETLRLRTESPALVTEVA